MVWYILYIFEVLNHLAMKKYIVTIALIVGYLDEDYNEPKLAYQEHIVMAFDEDEACSVAKSLDKTSYSVYESYAEEIE